MSEECKASPNMMKFFKKLLELKELVKKSKNRCKDPIIGVIHDKLEEIIKEKE